MEEDLNLDRMYQDLIIKAYKRYPYLTDEELATGVLGISARTLYRYIDRYAINKDKLRGRVGKEEAQMIGRLTLKGYKVIKT